MAATGVTGLFLTDDFTSLQGFSWYRTQLLPNFGYVLQGLESRLNATGFNYFSNMSKLVASGQLPIFTNRSATFFTRGALTDVSGDLAPVLVITWTSGDTKVTADYKMQFRAEDVGDATRKEFFPVIDIKIIPEV